MNERTIFQAAVEIDDPQRRAASVAEACGADVALRRGVDELLRAHESAAQVQETPADSLDGTCCESQTTGEVALDFLAPSDDPRLLGRLGNHEITRVIGRGGMGVVLEGRDTRLNRVVAIKVLAPELAGNAAARKRFLREARSAAAVVHQHVVTIHAVDEDRLPYLVMEYIDGQSLQEKIDREGHLELKEVLRIGAAVGPPYFAGRFSNGPVWVEVLAEELGLPLPAASLRPGGTNYAWGGAETGPGLSFFETPNVGMQIEFFLADRGGFTGDELIVLAGGSNDLLWQAPYGPGHVVENLRKHILDIAAAGGRTILVANSPVGGSSGAKLNELLGQELDRLQGKLGITIVPFDMAAVQAAILLSPGDFGLTNLTDPACPGCGIGVPEPDAIDTLVPNPDEYLLWDFIHWTRVVHAVIGEAAADVVAFALQP